MVNGMDLSGVSIFFVVIMIFLILCNFLKTKQVYPSGPWGFPVVGHLPFLDTYPAKTFKKWRTIYGDIFRIRMGSWNTVVLNGYDVIKAASEFDDDVFSDRVNFVSFSLQKDVNRGIHTLTSCPFNETYLQSKKTTAMALRLMTRKGNPFFADIVSTTTDAFCKNVISKGKTGPISVDADIHSAVGTLIYKVIYGRGRNEKHVEERVDLIVKLSKEFLSFGNAGNPADVIPWMKIFVQAKLAKFARILEVYRNFDDDELRYHKETFVSDKIEDITDLMIDNELKLGATKDTEKDPVCLVLYNNLKDLFGAGVETSSSTLLWLTLYMIAYPEIQHKVRTEIDDVVGRDRNVELGDNGSLHYTTAVINEVMRVTSIIPFATPHRALRDTNFMGFDVNEGTYIMFNIHSINNEAEYWGDPENFRPERLLDECGRLDKNKCNRVVPFSLGRRRCVGEPLARMQIFALFANLMQRCELLKPENEIIDLSPNPGLIYFPKPYRVTVRDRSKEM